MEKDQPVSERIVIYLDLDTCTVLGLNVKNKLIWKYTIMRLCFCIHPPAYFLYFYFFWFFTCKLDFILLVWGRRGIGGLGLSPSPGTRKTLFCRFCLIWIRLQCTCKLWWWNLRVAIIKTQSFTCKYRDKSCPNKSSFLHFPRK